VPLLRYHIDGHGIVVVFGGRHVDCHGDHLPIARDVISWRSGVFPIQFQIAVSLTQERSQHAKVSRKWDNLKAALALHFAHYNFCRVHGSLRITPAMADGVTNHIWTIEELVAA